MTKSGAFYKLEEKVSSIKDALEKQNKDLVDQLREAHKRIDTMADTITRHASDTKIHVDPERDERRMNRMEESLTEIRDTLNGVVKELVIKLENK